MNKLENFFGSIMLLLMTFVAYFVSAWGFQVFWNHLVLNIWQLFAIGDVVNTMQISYWVFFAIAIGIGLVYMPTKKSEITDDIGEAFKMAFTKIAAKLFLIIATLIVTSLVF